jgi:hypothetical protein
VAGEKPQSTQWTQPPWSPEGKSSGSAHITGESTPHSALLLFFAKTITLLIAETNRCYQEYLHLFDNEPTPQPDVIEAEMFAFLAVTLKMGHTDQGSLQDYWTKLEQLRCPFYGQTMVR